MDYLQQIGAQMGETLVKHERRCYLVVDEAKVRTKDDWIYVFEAVDPENRGGGGSKAWKEVFI